MWQKILFFLIVITNSAQAQPTIVEAIANTPDGKKNIAIIEQPNGENPLGNPIVGPYIAPQAYNAADSTNNNNTAADTLAAAKTFNNNDSLPQQAKTLGKQFKNTLMEANGEIYDVQSYPLQDINVIGNNANPQTIYSPNVNQ